MLTQDGSGPVEFDAVADRVSPGLWGRRLLRQLTDVHLAWWNQFPTELGVQGAFGGRAPSPEPLSAWLRKRW